jgi:DNA polymerase I-like protein with 3'-5' exonuclease and polymerase domains
MYVVDIETHDPNLNKLGDGSIRKDGEVLCVGIHGEGSHGKVSNVFLPDDPELKDILATKDMKVFHNGVYDMSWLVNGLGMQVNGVIDDTMTRETLIDEYADKFNLDACCQRRGIEGKNYYDTIGRWALEHGIKGKAIEHLKDMPIQVVAWYCLQDVKATYNLWHKQDALIQQNNLQGVVDVESGLYPILMIMKRNGIRIDTEARDVLAFEWMNRVADLRQAMQEEYGLENINSPKQITACMHKLGIHSNVITCAGNESWSAEALDDIDHPAAELLAQTKTLDKAYGTFIKGYFTNCAIGDRIHPTFYPSLRDKGGTITGRFSSQNPNLQNVPADDRTMGPEVRALLLPEPDSILCAFDYKQIEYTIFIHYAIGPGAVQARQAIIDGIDYHTLAQRLLKWDTKERQEALGLTPHDARKMTKNFNFGCMSVDSFICTRNRGYIRAKNLKQYDLLTMGDGKWSAFIADKEQCRISLSNGQQLDVTTDHQFLHGYVSDIKVGDVFPVQPASRWESNYGSIIAGVPVKEDMAYLIGLWIVQGRSAYYSCEDDEYCDLLLYIPKGCNIGVVKNILWDNHIKFKKFRGQKRVYVLKHRKLANDIISHCGLTSTRHIPDFIYSSPRSVAENFMRGLLDGYGRMNIDSRNEVFMRGVAKLCCMLGWGARWSESESNNIILDIDRNVHPVTVTSIDNIGSRPTFCMEVSEPHWYEAECTVNHNSIYGLGLTSFKANFRKELAKGAREANVPYDVYCERIYREYFRLVPFVRPTCQGIRSLCKAQGYMRSVGGRMHHLSPHKDDYVMVNYICQGGASDVLKAGLVNAHKAGVFDYIKLHITVHDENVFSCFPNKASIEAAEEFSRQMAGAIKLKVPIRVDEDAGYNWATCNNDKWKEWKAKYGG